MKVQTNSSILSLLFFRSAKTPLKQMRSDQCSYHHHQEDTGKYRFIYNALSDFGRT